jgi:ubiquinol-cytochrome c reductase cytochrome c1 subunit
MKRMILVALLAIVPGLSSAVGTGMPRAKVDTDPYDRESLQRGARIFVNYCLSCHSASYMRFSRLASDLNIADQLVVDNLMFVTDKIGNTMEVAMRAADAEQWFGVAPPDLSVIARSRGADWLYTFLTTFYLDSSRPTGVNNLVFKDTAMPHVLWELQGWQTPIRRSQIENGTKREVIEGLELTTPGKLQEAEFQQTVRDLVNFLAYMGEPAQLIRRRLGPWVIAFLGVLLVPVYLLKREYWRDIH